jgi:two-component system OmpR family response regulator
VGTAAASTRILVVDDEPAIADLLATALRYERFEVTTAGTGHDALATAVAWDPALILLDVMLPDVDGFELARRLAERGHRMPIIFVTARDSPADAVRGLGVGGDDYVTKPFSLDEVVARVRAVLRRTGGAGTASRRTFADVTLDDDLHEVRRNGVVVDLTVTEYNLLRFLMDNPRRVVSRAQILDHVWHDDFDGDDTVVPTYISYLRRKLDPLGPPLIHTIRGVGYSLRLPRSQNAAG